MEIKGLAKTTLLDYPGHIAATLFVGGCQFKCPFCHNGSLVTKADSLPDIPLEEVYAFLEKLPGVLAPGGRVAVLTFHSGEDRLVKQMFKQFYKEGIYSDIAKDVIRPSAEECARNSRAKSTKMRWAIRAQE